MKRKRIDQIDHRLSSRICIANQKSPLGRVAFITANSGDLRVVFGVLGLFWLLGKRTWHRKIALIAAGMVAEESVIQASQHLINRRRPEGKVNPPVRDTDPTSFPSGHAARTATIATIMLGEKPLWAGLALMGWALSVSLARVAIGRHFISDTLVGLVTGSLIGGGILLWQSREKKLPTQRPIDVLPRVLSLSLADRPGLSDVGGFS